MAIPANPPSSLVVTPFEWRMSLRPALSGDSFGPSSAPFVRCCSGPRLPALLFNASDKLISGLSVLPSSRAFFGAVGASGIEASLTIGARERSADLRTGLDELSSVDGLWDFPRTLIPVRRRGVNELLRWIGVSAGDIGWSVVVSAAGLSSSEVSAGETSAGETSAGEVSAGDTSSSDVSSPSDAAFERRFGGEDDGRGVETTLIGPRLVGAGLVGAAAVSAGASVSEPLFRKFLTCWISSSLKLANAEPFPVMPACLQTSTSFLLS